MLDKQLRFVQMPDNNCQLPPTFYYKDPDISMY